MSKKSYAAKVIAATKTISEADHSQLIAELDGEGWEFLATHDDPAENGARYYIFIEKPADA